MNSSGISQLRDDVLDELSGAVVTFNEHENEIRNNSENILDLKFQVQDLKSTSSHTVNFPSGACSDRFIKQIQLSPGTKLHNFIVSLGDISQGAFGMPVENSEDEDKNWVASLKIFIDSDMQYLGKFDFDGQVGDEEDESSFIINKFDQDGHQSVGLDESFEIVEKPVLITFVVEYGIDKTQDNQSYSNERLDTIEERLAFQQLFGQCVKSRGFPLDGGPELITPYKTNRNLIVSFEEER